MKYLAAIFILAVLVQLSSQVPKYENCDRQVLSGERAKDCVKVTCTNSKDYRVQECDRISCPPGKQTGYHNGQAYDEFPACCSYPVCKK